MICVAFLIGLGWRMHQDRSGILQASSHHRWKFPIRPLIIYAMTAGFFVQKRHHVAIKSVNCSSLLWSSLQYFSASQSNLSWNQFFLAQASNGLINVKLGQLKSYQTSVMETCTESSPEHRNARWSRSRWMSMESLSLNRATGQYGYSLLPSMKFPVKIDSDWTTCWFLLFRQIKRSHRRLKCSRCLNLLFKTYKDMKMGLLFVLQISEYYRQEYSWYSAAMTSQRRRFSRISEKPMDASVVAPARLRVCRISQVYREIEIIRFDSVSVISSPLFPWTIVR